MLDQVKIQKEREDVEKVKNDNLITEIQNTDNFLTIKVSSMETGKVQLYVTIKTLEFWPIIKN